MGNVQTRSCEFDICLKNKQSFWGEMIQFDLHMFVQIWLKPGPAAMILIVVSQKKNRWNIPDFEDRHLGGRLGM